MTSNGTGKIGLREPGEYTRGPNLASRDNVAHIQSLYTILETPLLAAWAVGHLPQYASARPAPLPSLKIGGPGRFC